MSTLSHNDQFNAVIADQPVDEVLVALPIDKYGLLVETIVRRCEEQGILVRVRTEMLSNLSVARSYVDELQGVPVITIQSGPQDGWQLVTKRMVDIVVSAVLLLRRCTVICLVALLIRIESLGPILFPQERVGTIRRRFRMLKFRTMMVRIRSAAISGTTERS